MNEVMKLVKRLDLEILHQKMELDCEMTLEFREKLRPSVLEFLEESQDIEILGLE